MKCEQCDDWEKPDAEGALDEILDHLRLMHPDKYDGGPDRLPDGSMMIWDETLEPEDFE